jgi:hypothetical protein
MKFDFTAVATQAKTKTWKEVILDRIGDGKVVPIVSNSFTDELAFGSHADLVEGWASYIQYPMSDQQHNLPRMAQYESVSKAEEGRASDEVRIKEKYLQFLKAALSLMANQDPHVSASKRAELENQARELDVSEMARRLNYPSLDSGRTNPLLLLAALPLPIYLTTSYHNFLEIALEKARKKPRSEICRWHDGLRSITSVFEHDQDYEPTPEQPLVYHFHGLDTCPESLVLTEDDHLDFLANISKDPTSIHPRVNRALTESSLVLVGYSLRNWDFRVLFRGVIKPRPQSLRMTNVAIQLEETPLEKEYVKKYLRQVEFEVEWSDTASFIQELYEGWER